MAERGLARDKGMDDEIAIELAFMGDDERWAAFVQTQHHHIHTRAWRKVASLKVVDDARLEPRRQQRGIEIPTPGATELVSRLTLHNQISVLRRVIAGGKFGHDLVRNGKWDAREDLCCG